jgi:CubicO group peptidase (beta-lactamase class C family)
MMRHLVAILAGAFLVAAQAAAQPALRLDQPVSGRIVDGAPMTYVLDVGAGRFIAGRAMQRGVDVVVEIVAPAGETIASFDSPNGSAGPEPFHFLAETAGAYRVVLRPFVNGSEGDYDLTLLRDEPAASDPGGRVMQMLWRYDDTTPGGALAVIHDGETIFEHAFGMANLTHRIPFSVDTPTNIGSVTKQFTAFAILLLADAGRLSLDDDIRTHIPELPDLGATVTIRHLLSHTSGYREVLNTVALGGRRIDQGDYLDAAESIEVVQRQEELQNAPGAEHNYNNTGYELLGTVITRVTGRPAADWMGANVFGPLRMHDTSIRETTGEIIAGSAQGYGTAPGGYVEIGDLGATGGAGGIYSTPRDLGRWVANLRSGVIGGPGLFERMTTPYVLTNGDTTNYAMGLVVRDWRGLPIVEHGGADAAHRAMLVHFPTIDATVIALSNDASFNAEAAAFEMAEEFFAEHLSDEAPAPASAAGYDPSAFDEFVGRYELDAMPGFVLTFSREGDRLLVQATGQPAVDLSATSDTTFSIPLVGASVTMHRDAGGGASTLTLHQNGAHLARRLDGETTEAPAAPDLSEYAGAYYSSELDARYEVTVEDGELTIRHRRFGPLALTHRSRDAFGRPGFPISEVEFERDEAGRVNGLRAGNGRTRGVWFGKVTGEEADS